MVEIIPSIIAQSIEEVASKIKLVEPYVKWAQLDIMDGNFVPRITWNKPEELAGIQTPLLLEADLMVEDPEQHFEKWLQSPVRRIFVQHEALSAASAVQVFAQRAHGARKEFGLAINPETPADILLPYLHTLDRILVRGATPGSYGQPFQEQVIHKVELLSRHFPHGIIEIDGGVRRGVAKRLVQAGARALVVGSVIFQSPLSAREAIEFIRQDAESK